MHSFLGLIALGNFSFLPRAAPPSHIVSGLSQAGEVRQRRDQETFHRQNEGSGYVKAEGQGSITPFFYSPPSPFLRSLCDHACLSCLSQAVPPQRNITHHWLTSHLPGAKQGEVKVDRAGAPGREIRFILLVVYGPKVSHSALAMGITASETRQGGSQHLKKVFLESLV